MPSPPLSSPLIQAIDWLKAAINECETRLANLDGEQRRIAQEISAGQARLGALNTDIARLERQKADLVQERKRTARDLKARQQELLASIEAKKLLLQKKEQSREHNRMNLENALQTAEPILAEIGKLRVEIEELEQGIAIKRQQLEESGGVRKRIEELQKQKEFALSLKPGYAQKMEFTRELLDVENPALATKKISDKVSRYNQLNQHLQECVFEDGE